MNLKEERLLIQLISLLVFLNGLLNLFSTIPHLSVLNRPFFGFILPFEFHYWSRIGTNISGLIFMYLSFNLYKQKQNAWQLTIIFSLLSLISLLGHRTNLHYGLITVFIFIVLIKLKQYYIVKSESLNIKSIIPQLLLILSIVLMYGTIGFTILTKKDIGQPFSLKQSFQATIEQLLLMNTPQLSIKSHTARLFINSLPTLSITLILFSLYSFFHPIEYELVTKSQDRQKVRSLVENNPGIAIDYFKLSNDKSYFFSNTKESVLAYKVVANSAICLGDPTGQASEFLQLIKEFQEYCYLNDWLVVLIQTSEKYLSLYEELGLSILKIGEEAVIDLKEFVEKTSQEKEFRRIIRNLENKGFKYQEYQPPHTPTLLNQLSRISKKWLQHNHRQEHTFVEGSFNRKYLNQTPIATILDPKDQIIAFANVIPIFKISGMTVDLMRHLPTIPNGTMDFLFVKLLQSLYNQGYQNFSLGLATLSGVGEQEGSTTEERFLHLFYEYFNRFFSFKGLRHYKDKFHPQWQNRYLVYQGPKANLLRIGYAIIKAT